MPDAPTTIEDMVQRLRPDRRAFEQVFDRLRPPQSLDFKSVSAMRAPDPHEDAASGARADFAAALRYAEQGQWLDRFTPAHLAGLTIETAAVIALQAVTNPQVDFDHIGDVSVGVLKAMQCCCRVVCGDEAAGTAVRGSGFLIGPQLVLTNWHVVKDQIAADAAADASPAASEPGFVRPPPKLKIEFDAIRRRDGTTSRATEEAVAHDWHVVSCPAHGDERSPADASNDRRLPDDLNVLKTQMDYAVIALANPVGYARDWYDLRPDLEPPEDQSLGQLIQFPGAFAMRVTSGPYLGEPVLPGRIAHSMNTIEGSSGGLCATTAYEPVALHQGALRLSQMVDPIEKRPVLMGVKNVAIPLGLIAEHAGAQISSRARSAPALLHKTLSGGPIIGRKVLQSAIHDTIYGSNRIILVQNSYRRDRPELHSGLGVTFSLQILEAMARPGEHLIRRLSAADLTADPFAAAQAILRPFRDAGQASSIVEAFDAAETMRPAGDTTQDAEVRRLAELVVRALQLAAGEQILWLVIDELDRHPVDSASPTANFLNQLYSGIAADPRLRAMLLGPTAVLPLLETLGVRTEGPLDRLEDGDIEGWIRLARGRRGALSADEVARYRNMAILAEAGYQADRYSSRTGRLAAFLGDVVGPMLS